MFFNKEIDKQWCMYIMEYYSMIKKYFHTDNINIKIYIMYILYFII